MPNPALRSRTLAALVVAVAATIPSHSAAAAEVDETPQAYTLPAPFTCGTDWQGTTYPGHGSHDWNLDLNRVGDDLGTDLGQPVLAQDHGTVVWFKQTGYNNHAGTYLEVDYGDVSVRYLHLVAGSIPDEVAEIGARVRPGQTIALLGDTGRVSGPHLHLEYWDSSGYDDSAWYQLPRDRQIPVVFEGREMIAAPGRPTPVVTSTNCEDPDLARHRLELQERRDAQRNPTVGPIAPGERSGSGS